ncbi:HTH_Tnp_Tc3_2 domain-containing protein [Trichonephila clavipes]|nr:HTH_Tnp_Tc3_2 domain-containing protein [Trichonephila clavipes]
MDYRSPVSSAKEPTNGLITMQQILCIAFGLIFGLDYAFCCFCINCWEQWTPEDTHVQKTGSGVTRKTTRREDRRIVRQTLVDPTVTRLTIRADVGVAIVPQTISRHLAEANFKSKRPFRALPLTSEHRKLRLQWCQARSMWNVTEWQKVVFSDESWFAWGQMITVYGCGGTLVSATIHPTLFYLTLPAQLM